MTALLLHYTGRFPPTRGRSSPLVSMIGIAGWRYWVVAGPTIQLDLSNTCSTLELFAAEEPRVAASVVAHAVHMGTSAVAVAAGKEVVFLVMAVSFDTAQVVAIAATVNGRAEVTATSEANLNSRYD